LQGQNIIRKTDPETTEISLYADERVTDPVEIFVQTKRLRAAFPQMSDDFYNILVERIIENKFTRKRLVNAINYVIDNVRYKELHVADIIGSDRRIKLYTYREFLELQEKGKMGVKDMENRMIDGKSFWIKTTDIEQFEL
jgi:hypothetical protein